MPKSERNPKSVLVTKNVPGENFHILEPDFRVYIAQQPLGVLGLNEITSYAHEINAVMATSETTEELVRSLPNLEVIVVNGAGYDDIAVAEATRLKIPVVNVPHITARPTAELALTLLLSLSRRTTELDRRLRTLERSEAASLFQIGANPGHTLEGKTLGILGMGHIGKCMAQMGQMLGMQVIYHQRKPLDDASNQTDARFVTMDELLCLSDVISIHCPLTKETFHLFDRQAFAKMKPTALLINTARGDIIDHHALADALTHGVIAGAGLDVFPNGKDIPEALFDMDNLVMTPHIGANTVESRINMTEEMCKVVRAVLAGNRPLRNLINPQIYA